MIITRQRALANLCSSGMVAHLTLLLVPGWFAFILSMNGDTFANGTHYSVMQKIMSEYFWAAFSCVTFISSLLLWWTGSKINTIASLAILCFWHGMVSTSLLLTFTVTTGTGTYAILALAATLRMFGLVYEQTR